MPEGEIPTWEEIRKAYTPYKEGEVDDLAENLLDSKALPPSKLRGWVPDNARFTGPGELGTDVGFEPKFVSATVDAGAPPNKVTDIDSSSIVNQGIRVVSPMDRPYNTDDQDISAYANAKGIRGHYPKNPMTGERMYPSEVVAATRLPGEVNRIMPRADLLNRLREVRNNRYTSELPIANPTKFSGFGQDGIVTSTQGIIAEGMDTAMAQQRSKQEFLNQLEQESVEQDEAGDGADKKSPEYVRDTQSEDEAAMEAQTAKLATLGLDPRKMSPEALAIARDFLSQRRNNSEFTPDLVPQEHFPEGTDEEKEASEKRRLAAGPKWTLRPGRTFAPKTVSDKEYAKDYDAAGQNTDEEREANTKEYKKRLRSAKRKAKVEKAQTPVDAQFPNGVNAWEVGAKAGDAAQTYRAQAAGYGNSAQDEQKALYDAAGSAQGLHDKVPGWVAQNMPVDMTPAEPAIPTWAEMKEANSPGAVQTRLDATSEDAGYTGTPGSAFEVQGPEVDAIRHAEDNIATREKALAISPNSPKAQKYYNETIGKLRSVLETAKANRDNTIKAMAADPEKLVEAKERNARIAAENEEKSTIS